MIGEPLLTYTVQSRRVEKSEAPSMRIPEPTGEHIPSDDEIEDHGIEEYL